MSAYELRVYKIAPGKWGALQDVFRELVLPLMPEYAMEGVGFWATPDEVTFYWIVRHDGAEAITSNWDRFHADPRWVSGLTAREQGDPFVTGVESIPLADIPGLPPRG